jgi:hypothetical protein
MALELTQPPVQINTRDFPGSKARQARQADSFTVICELII